FRVLRAGDAGIRLAAVVARDGANRTLGAGSEESGTEALAPQETVLLAPVPNPSRGQVELAFGLARGGAVELAVYGVDGRRVRELAGGVREAGMYHVSWDGRDEGRNAVAPGVYYAHLRAGGREFTRTLVLLR
ncbi:MAG TPA: FlgD immunoglobulin-like domain containing protein, partial [Candidatus Eisenbacteria bacterium]